MTVCGVEYRVLSVNVGRAAEVVRGGETYRTAIGKRPVSGPVRLSELGFDGDDVAFARYLTANVGVAPVPGSSFYRHGELGRTSVRFTFSKSRATLEEAVGRLRRAFA